jgi:hypothetical protein
VATDFEFRAGFYPRCILKMNGLRDEVWFLLWHGSCLDGNLFVFPDLGLS